MADAEGVPAFDDEVISEFWGVGEPPTLIKVIIRNGVKGILIGGDFATGEQVEMVRDILEKCRKVKGISSNDDEAEKK